MREIIDRLRAARGLPCGDMLRLLTEAAPEDDAALFAAARAVREESFGRAVYIRGLIEFTNFCKNDCLYCGIRRGNANAARYRLSQREILECAGAGYALGFRTFVLQGGEDPYFTDARLVPVVRALKASFPDCAVTLSAGERSAASYRALREAGADRYLLRHETANPAHYAALHPPEQSYAARMECLDTLHALGFQTGCGFMVGSPGQTAEHLLSDLAFIASFRPEMVGIGPFIPHGDTVFRGEPAGSVALTLRLLAIVRLLLPRVLLPATTALATLDPMGCERGMLAGANVVMPNLSPPDVRGKYQLYNGKASFGSEAAEALESLKKRMEKIGYTVVVDRGDYQLTGKQS